MSKRLLLADDSITIQKVIQITFAHEDYELTITDNGDTAFMRAKELAPDLVLADVYMPGKNGYELCSAIKQAPALQHVPVLLLAGSFEPFDEGKARACGADAWIEKPFESQSLIDKVAVLLSSAPAAAAPAAPAVEVEPPPPASADPFADITFEEPVAAAVPPSAFATAPDDWSDLAVSPAPVVDDDDFAFEEVPAEPFPAFPAAAEPPAFAAPAAPLEEPGPFADDDEIMALGDEDILGAEDLEPIGEEPTLTPWSREATALEESFEELAAPEPLAFAPPLEPPPVAPLPSLAPVAAEPPSEAAAPSAAPAGEVEAVVAEAEQRAATLTEAELERIVERAVGRAIERLAGGMLERVAWEVVPDLAEALIKDEIRKIKEIAD